LEATDVLQVLRGDMDAPNDLRERAISLAGQIFELSAAAPFGQGGILAQHILDSGRAWKKFQAICEAQGGMREPSRAPLAKVITASRSGRVVRIDNRKLARSAKLAGAPKSPTAGIEMQAKIGTAVEKGQPLFTLHAATSGEYHYALAYIEAQKEMITIEESA
jgi:thymidine phosphorylase